MFELTGRGKSNSSDAKNARSPRYLAAVRSTALSFGTNA
jgi:hypothetical protein